MGWPLKAGDFVEITNSFYPEKIGKVGRVMSVRENWENPYEINISGEVSQFPREYLSNPVSVDKIVKRLNETLNRVAELESAQEMEDTSAPSP